MLPFFSTALLWPLLQQAVLLDILLILPRLVEALLPPPSAGTALQLYAHSQSFVWLSITTCVVFGVVSCLAGQWPRIPYIAESADQHVR